MVAVTVLYFVGLSALLAILFLTNAQLLSHQRNAHADAWIRDGRPWPFNRQFSVAAYRSAFAYQWCSLKWLVITPSWSTSDQQARSLLRRFRWLTLVFNIGILLGVLLIVLSVASVNLSSNKRVNLSVRPVTGLATAARPAPVRPAGYAQR